MTIVPFIRHTRSMLAAAALLVLATDLIGGVFLMAWDEHCHCRRHVVAAPMVVRQHYLLSVPRDAWRRPLRLVCPSRHDDHMRPCDVSSAGPDGIFGTADDINSWDL